MDQQVREYLIALRDAGGVVNTSIAIASPTGIVRRHNSSLLAVNGGHIIYINKTLGPIPVGTNGLREKESYEQSQGYC